MKNIPKIWFGLQNPNKLYFRKKKKVNNKKRKKSK